MQKEQQQPLSVTSYSSVFQEYPITFAMARNKMSLRPYLVVSAPSAEVLNVHKATNVPFLVQNEDCVREMRFFDRGPRLPSIYQGRHSCHSHDKIY